MTPFFSLIGALAPVAFASVAPPPPISSSPAANNRPVRVSLGTFPRFALAGVDLQLNGAPIYAGETAFTVKCGTEIDGTNYVEYGAGRRTERLLTVSAPSGFFRVNGKLYRNRLLVISRDGRCLVVNSLSLDKYLAGLLNKEMVPSWPIEALKAQAVASRSYALNRMQQSRGREFDLESTTLDQVYDGAAAETPRSTQAVNATHGQVLKIATQPLKAYFHANCGGRTEVPVSVWGDARASREFRPVVCPYHKRKRDQQTWRVHLTGPQIEQALRKISGLVPRGFRKLASLEAGAPNENHRLNDVLLSDGRGDNFLVPAPEFRNAIGNTKVKSTAFQIAVEPGGYRIEGQGYGHGVGMCQVGARAMAEQGKTYRQILAFYYPLAKIGTN